jgi:hypothetical protein
MIANSKKDILPFLKIFLSLCFLAAMASSCETCQRKGLSHEEDKAIFSITTTAAKRVGGLGKPMPVVDFTGHISINDIANDPIHLCVIIVPKGTDVKQAIEEFKGMKVEFDENPADNKPIDLPAAKGYVYYIKTLADKQKGDVAARIIFESPLMDRTYEAYFVAHTDTHGTYFSLDSQPFTIEPTDITTDPTININDVPTVVRVVATQDIEINAKSTAANYDPSCIGGFLFIKRTAAGLTPQRVIGKLLEQGAAVPISAGFHPLPGQADVIVHNFAGAVTGTDELVDVRDIGCSVFSKGDTYGVYAYLVHNHEYVISPEIHTITMPKAEAQLTMGDVNLKVCARYLPRDGGLPAGCSDADLNYIALDSCDMTIVQNNGTGNADVGFLFVPDGPVADLATAIQTIQDLLLQAPDGDFYRNGDTIAYKEATLAANHPGGPIHTRLAYNGTLFKNPATYHVYAWLRGDAGDIFVSDVSVNKTVQIGIANVTGFKNYTDLRCEKAGSHVNLVIEPADGFNVAEGGFTVQVNVRQEGFIICDGSSAPSRELVENMLTNMINIPPPPPGHAAHAPAPIANQGLGFAFIRAAADYDTTIRTRYDASGEGIKGAVWVFAIQGQSIVYQKTQKEDFFYIRRGARGTTDIVELGGMTYEVDPVKGGVASINEIGLGNKHTLLEWYAGDTINKAAWKNGNNVPGDDINQRILAILHDNYKKGFESDWDRIVDFVNNMAKVANR